MNTFLKSVIKEAFDAETVGADIVTKNYTKMLQDLVVAGVDAAGIASAVSSAKAELQLLVSSPASDADLVAYVVSLSAGIADTKVQSIISAAAKMTLDTIVDLEALISAVKA